MFNLTSIFIFCFMLATCRQLCRNHGQKKQQSYNSGVAEQYGTLYYGHFTSPFFIKPTVTPNANAAMMSDKSTIGDMDIALSVIISSPSPIIPQLPLIQLKQLACQKIQLARLIYAIQGFAQLLDARRQIGAFVYHTISLIPIHASVIHAAVSSTSPI